MRKAIATAVVLVIAAGCSSSSVSDSSASSAKLPEPAIQLVQTSGVPIAARHSDGPLSVHYAMRVENKADELIKLLRVTVQSVGDGAYYVSPTSRPFDVAIDAKQREEVQFWTSARPAGTVVGANGPVTLRVTCQFDSAAGKFQHTVVQVVNDRAAITGAQ